MVQENVVVEKVDLTVGDDSNDKWRKLEEEHVVKIEAAKKKLQASQAFLESERLKVEEQLENDDDDDENEQAKQSLIVQWLLKGKRQLCLCFGKAGVETRLNFLVVNDYQRWNSRKRSRKIKRSLMQ